jgi:hypothetical protein
MGKSLFPSVLSFPPTDGTISWQGGSKPQNAIQPSGHLNEMAQGAVLNPALHGETDLLMVG